MANYDVTQLDQLGQRRAQLRAQLREVSGHLEAEVAKAHQAGIIQAEIARRTGMTRESIAQLCRPRTERWHRSQASRRDPNPPRYPAGAAADDQQPAETA